MVTLVDMDAEALSRILPSEPIALLPSNSDTPVYIHERLLSSVSSALRAAYQKEWEESKSRVYKFLKDQDGFYTDVTKDLLIAFVRWAYTGDYSTELVGISSFVEEQEVVEVAVEEADWLWGAPEKPKGKKGKNSSWGRIDVDMIQPDIPEPEAPSDTQNQLDHGEGPSTGMTNTCDPLFLHIQLYAFANIYLIDALKNVSKRKIIHYLKTVERSTSKASYTPMIFRLLEHASSYLTDDDPLLDWLAKYASWSLTAIRGDVERLEDLLGDGKFARLLVRYVAPSQNDPFKSYP